MDNRFAGENALVTGAGKGVARAIAKQLAYQGARVAIVDEDEEKLYETERDILNLGLPKPLVFCGDLSDENFAEAMKIETMDFFKTLTIAVLYTGELTTGTFMQLNNRMWDEAYRVQLVRTLHAARAVYPLFVQAGGGKLLTITSSSLKATIPGFVLSSTFRAAIGELMKSLSVEWAKEGILVNTVFPSRTSIDRTSPDDFAKAMMYFISDENTYMTGSIVNVDGSSLSCNSSF